MAFSNVLSSSLQLPYASYIKAHPSGYLFRYYIPIRLQPFVGKTEFRFSLKTGCLDL